MAIDVETLAAARTYTDDSLKGVGSVQGKNCTIQEITKEGTTNTVVFGWTDDEGNVSTSEMIVEDGKDGETGPKGDPGEKGETGEKGQTGASAYEVALENGFEGSEEDWLKSLTPTNIVTVSDSPFESHAGSFKINEISGKCEQFKTTGAQLIPRTITTNDTGLSVRIDEQGRIVLSGTTRDSEYADLYLFGSWGADVDLGVRGPIAFTTNMGSVWLIHQSKTLVEAVAGVANTLRITDDNYITAVLVRFEANTTYNGFLEVMLNTGSTPLPWEPYTGGMVAPNPDYPQEIKKTVVSEIKTHGKNIINQPCVPADITQKHFLKAGTYTASRDASEVGGAWYIGAYEISGAVITKETLSIDGYSLNSTEEYLYGGGSYKFSRFTITRDCYVKIGVLKGSGNTYLMLNEGSTEEPYEPYTESTITLSTPVELYGIGDVQDVIEDGKVVRRFAEIVFDGSDDEEWLVYATAQSGKYRNSFNGLKGVIQVPEDITRIANIYCTQYIPVSCNTAGTYGNNQGISVETVSSNVYIYDETYNTADVSLWKARLQANPMTVVYELAEPVIEDLPITDQVALNSLKTFNNLTYVEFDSEVEPTFSGETALTTEGSHILEGLAKSNALTLEYLDAATYICDNLP